MMKTVLDTLSKFDSDDIARLTKELRNTDLSAKAKQAVSILPVTGLSADVLRDAARTTGRFGRRYARNTTSYVAANPARAGLSVGAVAAIGVGAFLVYKALDGRKTKLEDDTLNLPAPEEVPAE